jgi:CDP-glucose 4,6-dehydratase
VAAVTDGFWPGRRVFVTGATGLVGSCLVKELVDEGARVVALVRDWVPESELIRSGLVERVTVVRGDVCDGALIERALGEYEVDTVLHLAAQTIVLTANRNPVSAFETNVAGTWALLEACRRARVEQVVLASSDKAYGAQTELPYTEDMPLRGSHPYDVSKSCADLIAQAYAASYAMPVAITRCANIYGGGDLNWSRIVPGTIRSVLRGERPVVRSDGRYVRDYLYVKDAARAYLLVASHLAVDRKLAGAAFNVSCETPVTVLELVGRITALMESKLEPDIRDEATNEIREQYLSAERARNMLGWTPLYDLDEGLRQTIAWYRAFLED